jgi:ribosomal protein S27AE
MNSTEQQSWIETFYKGLQELVDSTFPKTCNKCGRVYATRQEFLDETIPVRDIELNDNSGLFALEGGDAATVVGVFRNCRCGTTLMADFQDRRDTSEAGKKRREEFTTLLESLVDYGLEFEVARAELLKILHGKHSDVIGEILGEIKLP